MISRLAAPVLFALMLAAGSAAADPAAAKKLNTAGMKAYKQADYEAAKALFEKAIAEDPGFVKAHYNRASMAALLRDADALAAEFVWLRGSREPEAARVLAKSKTDADFRGTVLFDPARAAMGLPALADTPIEALVTAYGGWWSGVDMGMMEGWIEVRLLPGGKAKGRDHSGETGQWYPWTATWKVDGRTLVIVKSKKQQDRYELKDCSADSGIEGSLCLTNDDGLALSPGPSQ